MKKHLPTAAMQRAPGMYRKMKRKQRALNPACEEPTNDGDKETHKHEWKGAPLQGNSRTPEQQTRRDSTPGCHMLLQVYTPLPLPCVEP